MFVNSGHQKNIVILGGGAALFNRTTGTDFNPTTIAAIFAAS